MLKRTGIGAPTAPMAETNRAVRAASAGAAGLAQRRGGAFSLPPCSQARESCGITSHVGYVVVRASRRANRRLQTRSTGSNAALAGRSTGAEPARVPGLSGHAYKRAPIPRRQSRRARDSRSALQNSIEIAGYFRMLTARAITSPRISSETAAWIAIASFAQRASGMTSVGLNAVALVKPRYR